MTSYTFGDTSTALVGSTLDTTSANSGVKSSGSGVYDGNRVYRRDSVLSNTHHTGGDYQLHQSSHNVDSKVLHGGGTVGMSSSSSSLTDAFAGINASSVNDNAFADYLFKQQVMTLNSHGDASPQQYHRQQPHGQHSSSDISSVVAAVAAAATANNTSGTSYNNTSNCNGNGNPSVPGPSDFLVYQHGPASHQQMQSCSSLSSAHAQRQHSYSAHNYQGLPSNHQSPSAATSTLPGTIGMAPGAGAVAGMSSTATTPSSGVISHNASTTCLVDPLPSFLSSLPMPSSAESSKYSSIVASSGALSNKSRSGNTNSKGNSSSNDKGNSDQNKENVNNMSNNGNSALAAAAAAAAAAVVNSSNSAGSGIGNILTSAASSSDLASLNSGSHPYYNSNGNNQHSHGH
ncbi:hypothetical protein FB639_005226, partial [Coemansia asiatica]